MKVILLHDWLTGFRGGERVLEVFCEMFPNAPLYTLLHKKGSVPSSIEDRKIVTSFIDNIPGSHNHYRKLLPLFPSAAESLRITEKADLVLSSSHCVIKGVKKPDAAKHVCYIHSPMRYLYDQYDNYFGPQSPWYQRFGIKFFKNGLVSWDKLSNKNVDLFLANSQFVKQRISKYYELESEVVHPFVDLEDFKLDEDLPKKEDFYLMVTAFAPNKKVSLAIDAFNKMGKTLKIIGGGQQEELLRQKANSNIEFLGNCTREEVIDFFKKARGFVFPGVEDFGITPLESLASGTPVIARKIGGVLETLNEDVAEFFEEDTVESLIEAVESFEKKTFSTEIMRARARDFSKENFKNHIKNHLESIIENK